MLSIWVPDEDVSAQVCYLRQLARQRGFEVIAEYKDIASGAKARLPGLDALMADAKEGRFSVVLTNRLACLSIIAHSRAPLVFAALSTERTSAGSRWVIDGLDCLRVFGAAGIWFSFEMQQNF